MSDSCAVGTVTDYAGSVAPSGWLLCDGASYVPSDYPELYAAIGTSFGGDGSVFNVPDCRGRGAVGAGHGIGLTDRILAAKGGEESHTLTVAELAPHTHSYLYTGGIGPQIAAGNNYTNVSPATSGTSGTGAAHNNMPPFIVFNKIIKAIQGALVYSAWNKATVNSSLSPVESNVVWRSEPGDVIRWAGNMRLYGVPVTAGTPLFIDENIPYPGYDFYPVSICIGGQYSSFVVMEFSAAGIAPVNEIFESGYTDLIFSGITYVVGVGAKLLTLAEKKTQKTK
jgi:microcystin-dependent protein